CAKFEPLTSDSPTRQAILPVDCAAVCSNSVMPIAAKINALSCSPIVPNASKSQ
ncbi:hypothetical protein LOAG_14352, partial [Loa loa]